MNHATTFTNNYRGQLLIIGDSVSLGAEEVRHRIVIRQIEQGYVTFIRDGLKNVDVVVDAEVARTTDAAQQLLPGLLETHRPNVVLLFVGGADVDLDWRRFIASGGRVFRNAVPVQRYQLNLVKMSNAIREVGAEPVLTEVPQHCLRRRQERLEKMYGRQLGQVIEEAGGQPESDRVIGLYRAAAAAAAKTVGANLVPIGEVMSRFDSHDVIGSDGQHPTAKGHRVIAEVMRGAVVDAFQKIGLAAVA